MRLLQLQVLVHELRVTDLDLGDVFVLLLQDQLFFVDNVIRGDTWHSGTKVLSVVIYLQVVILLLAALPLQEQSLVRALFSPERF